MFRTTSPASTFDFISRSKHPGVSSAGTSERAFIGISALLFVATAALTMVWCASMSQMQTMPMPGGWTMSMAWMPMPGQTWCGAAASFVAMWVVMMIAMMLPSLIPMLRRYREAISSIAENGVGRLTALVGAGYFLVWTVFGIAVFPVGVALSTIEMQRPALARAVPVAIGVVILLAGVLQFTPWKAYHLACCRKAPEPNPGLPASARAALQQGLHFGLHCSYSCLNLTIILLVAGVMDLRAMAAVTAAITAERLAPAAEHVARAVGLFVLAAGLWMIVRAVALG